MTRVEITREDAQKVADAMGLTVYRTDAGWTNNPAGLTILDTVDPAREDTKIRDQRTASHGRFNIQAAARVDTK